MSIDPAYVMAKAKGQQTRVVCPACSPARKTRGDLSLSIHTAPDGAVVWHCWHCGEKGKTTGAKPHVGEKNMAVTPMRKIESIGLSVDALAYLQARGISEPTAANLGVVSGNRWFKKMSSERPALGFVYGHKGNTYAAKWRALEGKDFTAEGAAVTLYLADRLTDKSRVVITEGEMDALSYWEAGIEAVSIPSGAIAVGTADDAARLRWIAEHDALLADAKEIYLAVDMDGPGQTTAQELARRLGKTKCFKVEYPPGNKDANDVLVKLGRDALKDTIDKAQPWPIEGLAQPVDFYSKVLDLYQNGLPPGKSTGWPSVDDVYTLNPGNLVVVTGIPGHGKSTFIDAMLINAMQQHNWSVAYASFENPPEIHMSKLIALKYGKPFGYGPTPRLTNTELNEGVDWVNDHVTFLTNDGVMPTVESLIERFETAVRRDGAKACVVDPFNFIKLSGKDGAVDTEAINEMLSKFKMFAQRCEVVFFIVAHPAKPMNQGSDWVPTGYSISGSAHWYNRADFGLTMHRNDKASVLHVWKCRFAHQGRIGKAELLYDKPTGGFVEPGGPTPGDTTWMDDL
jgi:twinkle protein